MERVRNSARKRAISPDLSVVILRSFLLDISFPPLERVVESESQEQSVQARSMMPQTRGYCGSQAPNGQVRNAGVQCAGLRAGQAGEENPRDSYEGPALCRPTHATRPRQLRDEVTSGGTQPTYIRMIHGRKSCPPRSESSTLKEATSRNVTVAWRGQSISAVWLPKVCAKPSPATAAVRAAAPADGSSARSRGTRRCAG